MGREGCHHYKTKKRFSHGYNSSYKTVCKDCNQVLTVDEIKAARERRFRDKKRNKKKWLKKV